MSWRHVLGHDAAIAAFAAAWKRGRLGHAYLFVGPRGIGKFTFARELAKAVLCERNAERLEACDVCASCKLNDAGTHPDLFIIRRPKDKTVLPIGLIRRDDSSPKNEPVLLEQLALKPALGTRKVAILDDADDLNPEAANCFLKTLEEPPPGSLLILIGGANAEAQFPTILSRCQLTRFMTLSPLLVARILTEHGITDPVHQQRLLQLSAGSPGLAMTLDSDEVWQFRKQLLSQLSGGQIEPQEMSKQWMAFIDQAGKEAGQQRGRASLIFRLFIDLLNSALRQSLGTQSGLLDADEERSVSKIAATLGEERIIAWLDRALEADLQVDRSVQLVLVIEAFVDRISRKE